jgi:hypothetical protein
VDSLRASLEELLEGLTLTFRGIVEDFPDAALHLVGHAVFRSVISLDVLGGIHVSSSLLSSSEEVSWSDDCRKKCLSGWPV